MARLPLRTTTPAAASDQYTRPPASTTTLGRWRMEYARAPIHFETVAVSAVLGTGARPRAVRARRRGRLAGTYAAEHPGDKPVAPALLGMVTLLQAYAGKVEDMLNLLGHALRLLLGTLELFVGLKLEVVQPRARTPETA